ncbi:MAG: leucyl aminopeptidase [Firmicutes bacterium]|nr:leucyl aminopeptidase [Bacillota bacterium]
MDITTQVMTPYGVESDAIVMVVFSDEKPSGELKTLDEKLNGLISSMIDSGEISGKFREFTMIHTDKIASPRVLIMGLGKKKDFDVDKIRSMAGRAARILRRISCKHIAYSSFTGLGIESGISSQCITEGVTLGLYHFKKYKTSYDKKETLEKITILAKNEDEETSILNGINKGLVLAGATNMARDLVNEPANVMTPTYFVKKAEELSGEFNMELEVLDNKAMLEKGMGSFMCVAQGSEEPSAMVILKYMGGKEDGPVLGLVGKGLTFDSGGLCIKPADSMHRMYGDCSGACAVLGTMTAIAKLKIPVNVIAVMGMTENMPSGRAFRTGDIVKSYSGKTIEILNTDAEGRLVLADCLTYIKELGAQYIVDIATLTGGCVVALGVTASGIMGNHQGFIEMVKEAGRQASENMWQLPLYDDYLSQIHSDVADVENSGGRDASACTAGMFLKMFVPDETPWVHIDIAGTAMIERERTPYMKKPYLPKEGGTGVGVRTMFNLAETFAEKGFIG